MSKSKQDMSAIFQENIMERYGTVQQVPPPVNSVLRPPQKDFMYDRGVITSGGVGQVLFFHRHIGLSSLAQTPWGRE